MTQPCQTSQSGVSSLVLLLFLASRQLITALHFDLLSTLTHTHIHTLCVCTTSDAGGTVLHDRRGLVFVFVGAVLQRAGAL